MGTLSHHDRQRPGDRREARTVAFESSLRAREDPPREPPAICRERHCWNLYYRVAPAF